MKKLYDIVRFWNKKNIVPSIKEIEIYNIKFIEIKKENNKYVLYRMIC